MDRFSLKQRQYEASMRSYAKAPPPFTARGSTVHGSSAKARREGAVEAAVHGVGGAAEDLKSVLVLP